MKKAFVKIDDIKWGKDGSFLPKLIPAVVEYDDDYNLTDAVSDYLSDAYGFCHYGFRYQLLSVLLAMDTQEIIKLSRGEQSLILRQGAVCPEGAKVYIYAEKPKSKFDWGLCLDNGALSWIPKSDYNYAIMKHIPIVSGLVVGEFVCGGHLRNCEMANADIAEYKTGIKREKLLKMAGGKELIGMLMNDLKFYDQARPLTGFSRIDGTKVKRVTKPITYVTYEGGETE